MRCSQLFNPTLKEDPREAEVVSHKLLLRAGYIRKVANGIFMNLHLGVKVLQKLEAILREELAKIGAQEVFMPSVIPSDLWQKSGRWEKYGKELLRFQDRHENDYCLGPTHEEVVTEIVGRNIKSYRQLPVNVFQIQNKFRDEIRPRFGLMRGREFSMKDGYSFHADETCLDTTYQAYREAYLAIFKRCGLDVKIVEADSGNIGGSSSAEFMVTAETGEDAILDCQGCDYAANSEAAVSQNNFTQISISDSVEELSTPNIKTINDLCDFLSVSAEDCVKSVCYMAGETPVLVQIRADFDVNEAKLAKCFPEDQLRMATDDEIVSLFQSKSGYVGPKGIGEKVCIVADESVKAMSQRYSGANKEGFHLKNLEIDRDFVVSQWVDVRVVKPGESCATCGSGLQEVRGIEVGHIFKLGQAYSVPMEAEFLNSEGRPTAIEMGCYGIGVGRTMAAAIEQSHDDRGIIWPEGLAPYQVHIVVANSKKEDLSTAGENLYQALIKGGVEVLLDDRLDSPGVKFSEADLLGMPKQVIIGKTFQNEGLYELKDRKTGERQTYTLEELLQNLGVN